jgi:hypothetical protein
MSKTIDAGVVLTRRNFLNSAGIAVLSAGAVSLLVGCDAIPAAHAKTELQDVTILNVALGLEHEGIAAYQLGAESGLLQQPLLDVAVLFQGQHKQHRDVLIATIEKLGGRPVEAKPLGDYAKALNAGTLKNQTDVLVLAARLELGATNAYLGVIPSFKDAGLARVSGRLAADEAMHWTVLNNALGRQLPQAALTFGA